MFKAFGEFWKRYIDFQGRTGRKAFWLTLLAEFITIFVVAELNMTLRSSSAVGPPLILSFVIFAMMIPTVSMSVRRLRDVGYSPWWALLYMLSFPGWIALAIMHARPTDAKRSKQAAAAPAPAPAPAAVRTAAPRPAQARPAAPVTPAAAPAAAPAPKKEGKFYVFAVQGPAFGNPEGDMVREKAEALRDEYYEPAKNMELCVIYPHQWDGKVASNANAGVVSYSVSFDSFKDGIRRYLRSKGVEESAIEAGIAVSDEERLLITNPFSGVTVMGVPIPEKKSEPRPDYKALADKLAHCSSLLADDPEQNALEEQLLAGGEDAQKAITDYLLLCASGFVSSGWWSRAALLVRLIRKIGGANTEQRLRLLVDKQTNVWEYHTQIKDVASKELLALKTEQGGFADGLIPQEYAYARLLELQVVGPPEKRMEEFFALRDSAAHWDAANLAFYYFIAGGAARVLYPANNANLAFYAAQVVQQPGPNSIGWKYLKEKEGAQLQPSAAEAARLHEKYPLPASLEETAAYPY